MIDYQSFSQFESIVAGHYLHVVSKPGIPSWNSVTPASYLIAEHVEIQNTDAVLFYGTHHGAAAAVIAKQQPLNEFWITDDNLTSLECARRTLMANQISHAHVLESTALLPGLFCTFDVIVLEAPKGRFLVRRKLIEAWNLLKPGGVLYLAGANELGIQSQIQDAEHLFGNAGILDYKKGSRIARCIRRSPASSIPQWASDPGIAPGTWIRLPLMVDNKPLEFHTLPGVFSQGKVDAGTTMLLEHIGLPKASQIMDMGCGCGIIGIVIALRMQAALRHFSLDMADQNYLAVAASQHNLNQFHLDSSRVFPSDLFAAVQDQRYDLIVTNPPFHSGKEVTYNITESLFSQSHAALNEGGELVLVANRFIPYERTLKKLFRTVTCLAMDGRFQVISAQK